MEDAQLRGELRVLRVLWELHAEHQRTLNEEGRKRAEDSTQFATLVAELKESHQLEKTCLLEKISLLEKSQQGTSGALEGESTRRGEHF